MRKLCLVAVVVVALAIRCSSSASDGAPPEEVNSASCGDSSGILPRASPGDELCLGRDDCYRTAGTPVGGCPNVCSCLCYREACYRLACTLVGGCTEPPIYR